MKTLATANKQQKVPFTRILLSVAASMIGVQSEKNRQFDFEQTSFLPYVIVGILFVVVFVLSLVGLVNFILA